jgi:hypothetical protein
VCGGCEQCAVVVSSVRWFTHLNSYSTRVPNTSICLCECGCAYDLTLAFSLIYYPRYDPELLYYGAEHVELSVRVWMCGGSMESVPCSNVGHIYREFNRFDDAFDPLLKKV